MAQLVATAAGPLGETEARLSSLLYLAGAFFCFHLWDGYLAASAISE